MDDRRNRPDMDARKARQLILAAIAFSLAGGSPAFGSDEESPAKPEEWKVSEDTVEIGPEPSALSPLELRAVAQRRFIQLIDEKRYPEAISVALRVVEISREEFGEGSIELVAPFDNLATVQMLSGDYVAAENNYHASIELIERNQGILAPRLINPLIGLGATYNRTGLYDQGVEAFERALRISHVNEGFYNFDQFKIRDGLTESHIGLQDLEEANFQQQIQVEINQRKLGLENPEIVPAMYKLARWYERSGQLEIARATYQGARRMLKDAHGKNDPALIDALVGISKTYERQGLMAEAAGALKKALAIVETQPETDDLRRAELLVELGDLYTSFGKADSAEVRYVEAWQQLSQDDAHLEQREVYFREPLRVAGLPFSALEFADGSRRDMPADKDLLRQGYVLVGYAVSDKGRVQDARIIESEPVGLLDTRVVNTLGRSYYRPRLVDGNAVATEDLLYRHDFFYLEDRQADTGDEAGEPLEYPDGEDDEPSAGRLEYPDGPDG